MVIVLNSALQVFLKASKLNKIFLLTRISMKAIRSINLFMLVFFPSLLQRFIYMYDVSHLTKQ